MLTSDMCIFIYSKMVIFLAAFQLTDFLLRGAVKCITGAHDRVCTGDLRRGARTAVTCHPASLVP